MYRLQVKLGKSWKLGWKWYECKEEAEKRKKEMELVGHKVKIVETDF